MASRATRSCRPRPGHLPETVDQGGVVGLLPRRCGSGESGKVGSATTFDGGDGALIVDGEGFLQLEGSTEG
jgi:hypothetical protein